MAHEVSVSSMNSAADGGSAKKGRKIARGICIAVVCIIAAVIATLGTACAFPSTKGLVFNEIYDAGGSEIIGYSVRMDENAELPDKLKIPAQHENKPVCEIEQEAFLGCKSLKRVIIPDGVTSIGDKAFAECEVLERITIPDSVTSIGEEAFHYCLKLTDIAIPDGVTNICKGTFSDCQNLKSAALPR